MLKKRIMIVLLAVAVTLAAVPLVSLAQAAQGQQPPAGRGAGGGQGRGRGDGAPRGDGQGRGGDARGAQGRGGAAQAQGQAIKMLKPGLYMVTGAGGNSTVRVTNQGVLLVDTKNLGDQFYNDLVAQIKTVTPQPVKYAFITHVHQDHSGNIERFEKAGAQVVAYEGLNRNLHEGGPNGKGYEAQQGKPADANAPYKGKNKKVKLGNVEATVYHFAPGHTAGDSVVYFKDVKTVSLGDEFTATGPNCDYPMGGSILGWSKSLAEVLKLDFDTAIPGHGNDPLTKADVVTFQKRMDAIGKKAMELVKAGTSKEQLRQQIQMQLGAEMGMWQMTQVVNDMRLDLFYNEISNAVKGKKTE
jgi:glyoxylase-like metal-dependent hydrolase (beta-lactamase superfamily II)